MESDSIDRATPLRPPSLTPAPAPAFARAGAREAGFGRCSSARFGDVARLPKDKSGSSSTEYGLLSALLALAVLTGVNYAGSELTEGWTKIDQSLAKANGQDDGNGEEDGDSDGDSDGT